MTSNNDLMLPPQIINALYKQELNLKNNPLPGITFYFNENDITDIQADIEGPEATPYEGGTFRVTIKIPQNFPTVAPKGIFLTKIFHPNISEQGEICVNTLKRDWNPKKWSLSDLFQVIKCLLIVPFPQSALNEEAGKLFMEDYEQFSKIAKMFTSIHAMNNKNKNLKEQKNKIHFIFFLMNIQSGRGFSDREITFIQRLLKEKMNIYYILTHAENKSDSNDFKAEVELSLIQNHLPVKVENIFPVELKKNVFGLKELFNYLFTKYQCEKINFTINSKNLQDIKSFFLKDINSEKDIIEHATALSNRIINNFSLLASSLGEGPNIKGTTMLSCAVIKIISKIYDKDITDGECLTIIEQHGYNNEIEDTEVKKTNFFLSFFYPNAAAKEINYLGKKLIKLNNNKLQNNKQNLYKYINKICQSINKAIDNLDNIKD